jgi:hypothetical protein
MMEQTGSHLSRRNVLVVLGGGALAVGAVLAAPYRDALIGRSRSLVRTVPLLRRLLTLANAGYQEWLEQVGSTFTVAGGNPVQLLGVEPLNSGGRRPSGLRDRAFLLNFGVLNRGTMAGDLIYTIGHADYGTLRIFLSASGPGTPNRMLAVFN